jgi:(2R)-3-sulfolactate dehydrogenase (NADP+)
VNDVVRLTLSDAATQVRRALIASGADPLQAEATARALVAAEADGQSGHGLSRVPSYAAQVKAGKVAGAARPTAVQLSPATIGIDAAGGFAYPALELAVTSLIPLAREMGIASAAIARSHHAGQAGQPVERLAEAGLIGLIVSNTPAAMAFAGGRTPALGTNPLAFAAPLEGRAPLVIDLALSLVARSRIVAADKRGEAIPPGWALDANGQPTTDPKAALGGVLEPIGGAKGASLALMVEILAGALAGGNYGWEAASFLDAEGNSPGVGQVLIAIAPGAAGPAGFAARMTALVDRVEAEGLRLPGDRRLIARAKAGREGVLVPAALHAQITALAEAG